MLSGPAHHHRSILAAGRTQKVWCMWRLCVLYSAVCLSLWQPSEAARPRCGNDLLAGLRFVCGDRGIYFGGRGRGSWSGYGSRPRGKGIVDHCCHSAGCDLQHLEKYCNKPKKPDWPAPTLTTTTTSTTSTTNPTSTTTMTTPTPITPSSTTTMTTPTPITPSATTTMTTPILSSTQTTTITTTTSSSSTATFTPPTTALQFVFQKRLLQHPGPPSSPRRSNARRKSPNSPRRRKASASSRRGAARQQATGKTALGPQKATLS